MQKIKRMALLLSIMCMLLFLVGCNNTTANTTANKTVDLSVGEIIDKTQKALKTTNHLTITKEQPTGTDTYIINNKTHELHWHSVDMTWGKKTITDTYIVRNPQRIGSFFYYLDTQSYKEDRVSFSYCSRSVEKTTETFNNICAEFLDTFWEKESFLTICAEKENIDNTEYYVLEGIIPNSDGEGNNGEMKFLISAKTFLLYSFDYIVINPETLEQQGYLKVNVRTEEKSIQVPDDVINKAEIEEPESDKDISEIFQDLKEEVLFEKEDKIQPFSNSGPIFNAEGLKIKVGDSAAQMLNHTYQEHDIKYIAKLSGEDYQKDSSYTKDTTLQPNEAVFVELSAQPNPLAECIIGIINLSSEPLPASECTVGYLIYNDFDYIVNQINMHNTVVSEWKTLIGSKYSAEVISDTIPLVIMKWTKNQYNATVLRDEIFTQLFIVSHPDANTQIENILIQEIINSLK